MDSLLTVVTGSSALLRATLPSSCSSRCQVSMTELRRAAIHLLLSMLCLPLHFQTLIIQGLPFPFVHMGCLHKSESYYDIKMFPHCTLFDVEKLTKKSRRQQS